MKFLNKPKEEIINYQSIRQSQLNEISIEIKQARIEKNLDINIISHQLYIPLKILKALESSDLESLPEPVFTKQLIKKYANFLKLNGEDISNKFSTQLQPKIFNKKKSLKGLNFKLNFYFKPQHLYIFYFLILFFSVRNLSHILESSQFTQIKIPQKQVIETNIPSKNNSSVNTTSTSPTSPKATPIVEKKEEKPPIPTELIIKITVKEDSWVKIVVDEKPTFEGILTKGLEKQWSGKEKITIRAGNAGGLTVKVNNENPKTLGKSGEVVNTTFKLPSQS